MGNVIGKLKTGEALRIPFGVVTSQVLDHNKVKHWVQLKSKRAARQTAISSPAVRTIYRWTSRVPLRQTWSHASSGLASFTFHFRTISSRHESIRAAQGKTQPVWVISASQTGLLASNPWPLLNWFISRSDEMCKWNWPFGTGGRQLLTLRERGSSPLAWLDEYKLTYSPSPPSSFALSLYGKRGGIQTEAWGSGEGHRATAGSGTNIKCMFAAKEERQRGAENWFCTMRYVFSPQCHQDHQVALKCAISKGYSSYWPNRTCSATCSSVNI